MGRLFHLVQRIEAAILATAMIAIAGITIVNVCARNLLGRNLAAAEELNGFLIVVVCFVGLSYAAGKGRHIRMSALHDQLGPRARKLLLIVVSGSTAALMFVLAWYALAYAIGVDRESPVLGVPLRLVYLSAPVGFLLAGLQYGLALWRNLRRDGAWVSFERADGYQDAEPSA